MIAGPRVLVKSPRDPPVITSAPHVVAPAAARHRLFARTRARSAASRRIAAQWPRRSPPAAGAPTAGVIISEGVRAVTRKRRSRPLFITVAAAVVLGAVPVILFQLMAGNIFGIIFQIVYLVIVTPVIYTRLSGIQLFR